MLENITASSSTPANNRIHTVIWQGLIYRNKHSGEHTGVDDEDGEEFATDFATEVIPSEWGHLSVEAITKKEGLTAACGEEHDGNLLYDAMDLLHVIDGAVITLDDIADE